MGFGTIRFSIVGVILGIILGIAVLIDMVSVDSSMEEEYQAEYRRYKARYNEARKNADWARQQKPVVEREFNQIVKERQTIGELLEDLYALDIIPIQYREIEAVCYIYDYISTSPYGIENAMMDFRMSNIQQKLDEISQKLNYMIRQNDTRILLDIQNQAALETLKKQNQSTLDYLQKIEDSAEANREYQRISTAYAKANTYLSLGTYLNTLNINQKLK